MSEHNIWKDKEGGFVFISHSHEDIKKVRQIRNKMEQEGFEPLCFYLKCLEDDEEVEKLIYREIDAREWFVYVDSQNARNSDWVQKEIAYIQKKGDKKIMVVDLDRYEQESLEQVTDQIVKSLRVFLSYHYKDKEIVTRFKKELEKRDLQVMWDDDIPLTTHYQNSLSKLISDAAGSGGVVMFLSQNSMNSPTQKQELHHILNQKMDLLVIRLGDVKMDPVWKLMLSTYQWIACDLEPSEEQFMQTVRTIEEYLLCRYPCG